MNAPNWLLRGVIFGFTIGVTLTLLCSVVRAEHAIYVDRNLVTCDEDRCRTSCELKMAEVMKKMDDWILFRVFSRQRTFIIRNLLTDQDKQQWDAVMKDCVKP